MKKNFRLNSIGAALGIFLGMQALNTFAQDAMTIDGAGQVGIGTETPAAKLHVKYDDGAYDLPFIVENTNGINFSGFRLQISPTSFIDFNNAGGNFRINSDQIPGAEFEVRPNGDATLAGALTQNSDVNAKQNIEAVNQRTVLAKVMALPIAEWSYKDAPTSRHIGPMAQDFHQAFSLGDTDKGISSIDTGGVALAAIQAVKNEKDSEIAQVKSENKVLKSELRQLRAEQDERMMQLEMALAEVLRHQSKEVQVGSTN